MKASYIIIYLLFLVIYYYFAYKKGLIKFIPGTGENRLEEKKADPLLYQTEEQINDDKDKNDKFLQTNEKQTIEIPDLDKIIVLKKGGKKGMVLRNNIKIKLDGKEITTLDLLRKNTIEENKNETTDKVSEPQKEERNVADSKKATIFDKNKLISKTNK